MDYTKIATDESIEKTIKALKENGINAEVVTTGEDAKKRVLELIPEGSEVMTMTSTTLTQLGLDNEINESDKFNPVKKELEKLNRETDQQEMQRIGAAPQYSVGSVHAVTEDGKVIIASNTGSQLPAYAYGASHVIWVVSAKKITPNLDEGMKRVYEHVLPLESERAHKAYGVEGSYISKLLIINREINPERITLIFVKEDLGF